MFLNFYEIFCIDFYRLSLIIKNLHNVCFQKFIVIYKILYKFSTMNLDETLVYYRLVCSYRQMHFMVLVPCVMVFSLFYYENSHFYLHITWQIFISFIFIDILRHHSYKRKIMFEHTKYKTNRQRDLRKSKAKQEKYIIVFNRIAKSIKTRLFE